MYAGSLGINPGDYLNPDGSVSIGLLPTTTTPVAINDGITHTAFNAVTLDGSTVIINQGGGGSAALPQTSTSCASNCQGGITSAPPYGPGTATLFTPASAPEFDLIGDGVDTSSAQAWISNSNGTGTQSTVSIPVGIFGVADVSTMLNTVSGLTTGGTVCTAGNGLNAGTSCTGTASYAYITLNFSTSASGATLQTETFALINGLTQANILDGATAGTSGSTSDYIVNYLGTNYTVDTGAVFGSTIHGGVNANDSLVLDAQEFPVFEQFQSLYLTSVSITDTGTGASNHEVLSAVSITATPEPSTLLLLGAGLAVMGVTRFGRKSVKA
jgi:hypothetical protein